MSDSLSNNSAINQEKNNPILPGKAAIFTQSPAPRSCTGRMRRSGAPGESDGREENPFLHNLSAPVEETETGAVVHALSLATPLQRVVEPAPLYYTPEPGYYDGPEISFTDILTSNPDDFNPAIIQAEAVFSYLDIYAPDRGGIESEDDETGKDTSGEDLDKQINDEISRSHACGNSAAVHIGLHTMRVGYHVLKCRKHWCSVCGGKGGENHKRRKQAIHSKIDMETESLRQMVYTVPKEDRHLFMSRAKLNGLIRSAEKISKHFFPGRKQIAIPHLFGDPHDENMDNDLEYNPHVNILTVEPKQTRLKLSPEGLKAINKAWQKALKGHGCLHADIVDIHYSFREKDHHIGHSIKYMTRPTWGERQLIAADQKMRKFLTLDLKGFTYLRYFDELAHCKYDESVEMTVSERETIESVTGERWMKIGYDKNINFKMRVEKGEMEEVLPGFYILIDKRYRKAVIK